MKPWVVFAVGAMALVGAARGDSLPAGGAGTDLAGRGPQGAGAAVVNDPSAQSALLFNATREAPPPPGPRLPTWVQPQVVDLSMGIGAGSNVGEIGFGLRSGQATGVGVADYSQGGFSPFSAGATSYLGSSVSVGSPGYSAPSAPGTSASVGSFSYPTYASPAASGFNLTLPLPIQSVALAGAPGAAVFRPPSANRAVSLLQMPPSYAPAGASGLPVLSAPVSHSAEPLPPLMHEEPTSAAAAPYRRPVSLPSIWWFVAFGLVIAYECVRAATRRHAH